MTVILAIFFFTLKLTALILGSKNKWLLSSLVLSLASFCLDYFKTADSVALQRIWAASEKHWYTRVSGRG